MSFENKPQIEQGEHEISWTATAERFIKKIDEERTKNFSDDGGLNLM